MGLDQETIDALLRKELDKSTRPSKKSPTGISQYSPLVQARMRETRRDERKGPLRWYNEPRKCASRGCGVQCYTTVEGVPYCGIHALRKLNELVIKMTEERFMVVRGGRPTGAPPLLPPEEITQETIASGELL